MGKLLRQINALRRFELIRKYALENSSANPEFELKQPKNWLKVLEQYSAPLRCEFETSPMTRAFPLVDVVRQFVVHTTCTRNTILKVTQEGLRLSRPNPNETLDHENPRDCFMTVMSDKTEEEGEYSHLYRVSRPTDSEIIFGFARFCEQKKIGEKMRMLISKNNFWFEEPIVPRGKLLLALAIID